MIESYDDKVVLLYTTLRQEIEFRRSREQQVFTWSSAIFVAAIGAMLLSKGEKDALIATSNGKSIAYFLVIIVSLGSGWWQIIQRKYLKQVQRAICRVMIEMELFDLESKSDGSAVFNEKWKNWGNEKYKWYDPRFYSSKFWCTFLLGCATLLTIYFR